jgi:hypothetical protein
MKIDEILSKWFKDRYDTERVDWMHDKGHAKQELLKEIKEVMPKYFLYGNDYYDNGYSHAISDCLKQLETLFE